MIPHQFFYLLVVLGLLWIFFMLHVAGPTQGVTPLPVRALPRRRRPNKPTPFAGLTQKPPCARCEHDTAHPTAPSGVPPEPVPRPTDVPARWTPPGIFVPMWAVTIEAGWGWATCAPTAIPMAARGASCTVALVRDTFWRRTARSCMANGWRWS